MRTQASRRPTGAGLAIAIAALAALLAAPFPTGARAADARPARKDSRPQLKPKEVALTPSVTPTEARAGATVVYKVTARIDPGWHLYKYLKVAENPRNTTFDFFDLAGLKVARDWKASREPIQKAEPAFNNEILEFYEDEVSWSIQLLVPPGTPPGRKVLRCQVGYQICNDRSCLFPGRWTLPDVVLDVLPGGVEAAAPADTTTTPIAKAAPAPAAEPAKPVPPIARDPASKGDGRTASRDAEPVSEVAAQVQRGLIPFLLFSAGGGLLALVMPCVWPMVPITVNFFVKQGQKDKGRTTRLAVAYCLAIIGVFTAFGVLVSFFFSATALQNLANNPWLNTFVAVLFLAFGLSLLGLFEIRLPNALLNASARGEGRGGLVGVMFMALTLTITSFTCTFPVVGGLIVMAAGGQFFYPILGLATFATVLAFPFFLLALAPGLVSRMPRSGDWMNAVKVVGGLVEIGAALKFVNTAEIGFGAVPSDAWFDAQAVLSIWVVLAAVSGLYLLGVFRTDHDHEEIKVGPGRLLAGSTFLALALFLAPALFGRPPQSKLWYQVVGIFPADVAELNPAAGGGGAATGLAEQKAHSTEPEQAEREQTSVHGVAWGMSFDAARERARAEGKPILIDFTGVNCANCRTMEQGVMPRPEVAKLLGSFVTVQLYTDFVPIESITAAQRERLAEKNQDLQYKLARDYSNPFYVALGPDGRILGTIGGSRPASVFVQFLNDALSKLQVEGKVAQAEPAP